MERKKVVVLTGAGISAESGIPTFRDSNGLWEGHDVMEVASIEGWHKNPELVQDFYNMRRKAAAEAKPNTAHKALVKLESLYDVTIVTQNVDTLHERAGSTNIIHLHGRLDQARSSVDAGLVYDIENEPIKMGQKCDKGSQLRPNIVWFGEAVPEIDRALQKVEEADYLIVVGTSLVVYPAASLLQYIKPNCQLIVINTHVPTQKTYPNAEFIERPATFGVPIVVNRLLGTAVN